MSHGGTHKKILRIRRSRKKYILFYILSFVSLGMVTQLYFLGNNIPMIGVVVLGLAIIIGIKLTEINRLSHLYEINQLALVHTKGIFSRHSRRIHLGSISDVIIKQGVFQRLFDYGDVHIRLFSPESTNVFKSISNPHEFARILETAMRDSRMGHSEDEKDEKDEFSFEI